MYENNTKETYDSCHINVCGKRLENVENMFLLLLKQVHNARADTDNFLAAA